VRCTRNGSGTADTVCPQKLKLNAFLWSKGHLAPTQTRCHAIWAVSLVFGLHSWWLFRCDRCLSLRTHFCGPFVGEELFNVFVPSPTNRMWIPIADKTNQRNPECRLVFPKCTQYES